jgi:hypothetical protein
VTAVSSYKSNKKTNILFLVIESKWSDVFEAGIGGQRAHNDREEPRVPSAYLLVYINAEQKSLPNG